MRLTFLLALFSIMAWSCNSKNLPMNTPETEDDFSASTFTEFLEKIEESDRQERQSMVDSFLDTLSATPIIEQSNCYFIYAGNSLSVQVAGDFNFWNPLGTDFDQVKGTNLWYRKEVFPMNARLDYKLVVGKDWILDPRNPVRIGGGFGPNSELAMPEYVQPWEIEVQDDVPKGSLTNERIASEFISKEYTVRVYTPPNYDPPQSYPTVYFQDGDEYLNLASSATIIDNLIARGSIEPVIGVFVVPNERNSEYAGDDRFKYRDFFCEELVPFIDQNYSTDTSRERRAVLGDSYGGNISAIIGFSRSDVFGNCGLHSGAFQEFSYDTNDIVTGSKRDIQVASIWGGYEGGLTTNMRSIRDHFVENDYNLVWKELPEGHSWGLWRATIDDMLVHFFPANQDN